MAPVGCRCTIPSPTSSRSCSVRTFCEMPGMTCRIAAKCLGASASQYTMINFHLPPIAASAAVNGHPPTGLGRRRRVWLPAGAFLIGFIGQIIFLLDRVTHRIIAYRQKGLTMIVEVRSHRIKPGSRRGLIQLRTFLLIFSLVVISQPLHGLAQK